MKISPILRPRVAWPLRGRSRRSIVRLVLVTSITAAAVIGAALTTLTRPDQGLTLAYRDGQVVVDSVTYGSIAERAGMMPGQIIVQSGGDFVLQESEPAKRAFVEQGPWFDFLTARPDQISCDAAGTCTLSLPLQTATLTATGSGVSSVYTATTDPAPDVVSQSVPAFSDGSGAVLISAGDSGGTSHYYYIAAPLDSFHDLSWPLLPGPERFWLSLAVLLGGWIVLGRGWAGRRFRRYALTLPVATAVPLFVIWLDAYGAAIATVAGAILLPASMLPLAVDLVCSLPGSRRRWIAGLAAAGFAVGAAIWGLLTPAALDYFALAVRSDWAPPVLVAAAVPLIPGLPAAWCVARSGATGRARSEATPHSILDAVDTALAALLPAAVSLDLMFRERLDLWPLIIATSLVVLGARFLLVPMARMVARARRQRDLVMEATEAERARIAADIHDFALQDLTLLVRRLDAAGDTSNAAAAREIADRLRGMSGELRLPVLDDLGVGPALEWLCDRLSATAGKLELDREPDEIRLPADVELAVFRIAQEALSNAIRHGKPPISVRYRAGLQEVELVVEDSGPGMADANIDLAAKTGHLGMLNMTQRAEAIGATLDIEPRSPNGTRVTLVRRAAPGTVIVPAPAPA